MKLQSGSGAPQLYDDDRFICVKKDESDTPESFVGGYDFKEAFLGPYQT